MEFIILLKYAFLGLVQGFTEPIPISLSLLPTILCVGLWEL